MSPRVKRSLGWVSCRRYLFWPVLSSVLPNIVQYRPVYCLTLSSIVQYITQHCPVLWPALFSSVAHPSIIECQSSPPGVNFYCWESILLLHRFSDNSNGWISSIILWKRWDLWLDGLEREKEEGGGGSAEISLRCEGSVWLDLDIRTNGTTHLATPLCMCTLHNQNWDQNKNQSNNQHIT